MYKIFAVLISLFMISTISAESISLNDSLNSKQNSSLNNAFGDMFAQQEQPLLAEEAFNITHDIKENKNLTITIVIEPEHYLYLHKLKLLINNEEKPVDFLDYVDKYDEHYGQIKAIYNYFSITINNNSKIENFELEYQGCSEKFNICYPLQTLKKKIEINQESKAPEKTFKKNENEILEKEILEKEINIDFSAQIKKEEGFFDQYIDLNKIKESISIKNKGTTFLMFFIAGILISFTPCVLPMIPIISSIVVGGNNNITNFKAFWLSLSYVLGASITYASFGAIAGLFSENIQIYMQHEYVITTFAILLFVLSLSLFGLYEIRLPSKITNKTNELSNKLRGGQFFTVFLMGILSTLILSPCVAAPLAAGITYIAANSGDSNSIWFGAFSLFSFGMGIGIVLIIITTLLNSIKIKGGVLMNEIKYLSGVLIIIVSIFIASRIIPDIVTIYLYQITILSYLISVFARNYEKLKKGFIMLVTILTTMLYLNDMENINNEVMDKEPVIQEIKKLNYVNVKNIEDIKLDRQHIIVKFTADWCTYCKKMERDIFNNPEFYNNLSDFKIYVVDLTEPNDNLKAVTDKFRVVAPPALFFFKDGKVLHYKVGETKKEEMPEILKKII